MEMSGEYRIPASRKKVWAALNDPETLKASLPGCESLERVSDQEFAATVVAKVGPVRGKFNGQVTLSALSPPEGYRIAGEGQGGVAGFAKGGADVRLIEESAELTVLTYTAKADVGGKLAQLGSRLIDATAKKMADEFFDNFRNQLTKLEAETAPEVAPASTGEAIAGREPERTTIFEKRILPHLSPQPSKPAFDITPQSSARDIALEIRQIETESNSLHDRLLEFRGRFYVAIISTAGAAFFLGASASSLFWKTLPPQMLDFGVLPFEATSPALVAVFFFFLLYLAAHSFSVLSRRRSLLRSRDAALRQYFDSLHRLLEAKI